MWTNDTYCSHHVDLIQSQLQQCLITTLSHQFERRLLQTRLAVEQQAGYMADTLERQRERCVDMSVDKRRGIETKWDKKKKQGRVIRRQ